VGANDSSEAMASTRYRAVCLRIIGVAKDRTTFSLWFKEHRAEVATQTKMPSPQPCSATLTRISARRDGP